MNSILRVFDEEQLRQALEACSDPVSSIAAMSCSQRLFSFLQCYFVQGSPNLEMQQFYERAMQAGWATFDRAWPETNAVEEHIALFQHYLPNEENAIAVGCPYALDAAIVLFRALESIKYDSLTNSIAAMRQAYSLVDGIVVNNTDCASFSIDDLAVESNDIVQQELMRQARDVRELVHDCSIGLKSIAARLRQRAIQEGDQLWEILAQRNWT